MDSKKPEIKSIGAYIRKFPKTVQATLSGLRSAIKAAAPDAIEKISYQMPAFWLNGNLVYFAAYEKHIGFYPTASGIKKFSKEIAAYKNSKGAVQFPIEEPLPLDLITKMVKFRVEENSRKAPKRRA
jgi:uncharacterized protein YdhG (YjbR/CyaY superfamily)